MSRVRVISSHEAHSYENWSAPLVEGVISSENLYHVKPPTADDIQTLQKEAYEEAFNKGLNEGRTQGYQEGKQLGLSEFTDKIELFKSYIAQLHDPLIKLDDELENNIVELSLLIGRHIIRRELKLDPGEVVAAVREAIKALPVAARNPRIYLHPEDVELVRQVLSIKDEESQWVLEDDPLLTRGGCRVQTENSLIDASVEKKLSAIAAKLLGGERDSDSDE